MSALSDFPGLEDLRNHLVWHEDEAEQFYLGELELKVGGRRAEPGLSHDSCTGEFGLYLPDEAICMECGKRFDPAESARQPVMGDGDLDNGITRSNND